MRHDDVHLAAKEFGREPWEPFVLVPLVALFS